MSGEPTAGSAAAAGGAAFPALVVTTNPGAAKPDSPASPATQLLLPALPSLPPLSPSAASTAAAATALNTNLPLSATPTATPALPALPSLPTLPASPLPALPSLPALPPSTAAGGSTPEPASPKSPAAVHPTPTATAAATTTPAAAAAGSDAAAAPAAATATTTAAATATDSASTAAAATTAATPDEMKSVTLSDDFDLDVIAYQRRGHSREVTGLKIPSAAAAAGGDRRGGVTAGGPPRPPPPPGAPPSPESPKSGAVRATSVKQLTKQQSDEFRAKTRAYREVRKNRLRWKPPDKLFKVAEGDEDKDEDGDVLMPNEERKLPAREQICSRGQPFLKHGRRGKPHVKIINVEAKTGMIDWGSGTMYLQDVVEVFSGKITKVFESVKEKTADQKCCFSIITPTRTLDLQAADEDERDLWVRGLRDLKQQLDDELNKDASAVGAAGPGGSEAAALSSGAGVASRLASADPDADSKLQKTAGSSVVFGAASDDAGKEESFDVAAARGVSFIKHGRNGKPHEKVIKVNLQTGEVSWGSGSIFMKEANDIKMGKKTAVFSMVPFSVADPRHCLSIVASTRSLDLQAKSEAQRNAWVYGLRKLKEQADAKNALLAPGAAAGSGSGADRKDDQISPEFMRECQLGVKFIKHNTNNSNHSKVVYVNPDTGVVDWKSGCLNLKFAIDIVPGKNTTVFRDVKVDPKLCFSIRCTSRTLDLQAKSEEQRDQWVTGLSQIHAKLLPPKPTPTATAAPAVSPATTTAATAAAPAATPASTNDQKTAPSTPTKSDTNPMQAAGASPSAAPVAAGATAATGSDGRPNLTISTARDPSAPQTEKEREDETAMLALMARGSSFLKFGRYAKAKSKVLTVSPVNGEIDWSTGSINIKYLTDIVVGKKIEKANPRTLFSLVSADRSFDFQATSEDEREMWVKGLRLLHNRFRSKAPAVQPASPRPAGTSTQAEQEKMAEEAKKRDAADISLFLSICKKGSIFIKHPATATLGKPHPKTITIDPKTGIVDWGSGHLNLKFTVEITSGKTGKAPSDSQKFRDVDPRLCFTILVPNRSLDLQAKTEAERNLYVLGCRYIHQQLAPQTTSVSFGIGATANANSSPTAAAATAAAAATTAPTASNGTGGHSGGGAAPDASNPLLKPLTDAEFGVWSQSASRGEKLIKHGRKGKPKLHVIKVDAVSGIVDWETGSLNLKYVRELQAGKHTQVFERDQTENGTSAAPAVTCLSLIDNTRTLDLQAKSEDERNLWFRGLSQLLRKFQTIPEHKSSPAATATAPATAAATPTAASRNASPPISPVATAPAPLAVSTNATAATAAAAKQPASPTHAAAPAGALPALPALPALTLAPPVTTPTAAAAKPNTPSTAATTAAAAPAPAVVSAAAAVNAAIAANAAKAAAAAAASSPASPKAGTAARS